VSAENLRVVEQKKGGGSDTAALKCLGKHCGLGIQN